MRILLASTSSLALPTFELLRSTNHQTLGLLTKTEKPAGRGRQTKDSSLVDQIANSMPIYRINDDASLERLLFELKPDLVIAISFGMLVKKAALDMPKHGWINLHFSLLPKYRGAAPVQRAILAGEHKSGVTVFFLDEGMDTGPIYAAKEMSIEHLNAGEALNAMANLGANAVLETLSAIENGVPPINQIGHPSSARKISKEETKIAFDSDSEDIGRQIRALSPLPGAWCTFRGTRFKILKSESRPESIGKPGEIFSINPLLVATDRGAISILEIQESGKRVMSGEEWARGARPVLGETFE